MIEPSLRTLAAAVCLLAAAPAWGGAARYPLPLGGSEVETSWTWPEATEPKSEPNFELKGLVLLQHGFSRHCMNLRGTAQALADAGWLVLCLNAPMAGGNAVLAQQLAQVLAESRWRAPGGGALPQRIVVGGHSAGAAFAARVGLALQSLAPGRLAGALLFDPVGVPALPSRPTLALLAPPMPCNAMQRDGPLLRAAPDAQVIELAPGATHMDVEGEDTDGIASRFCQPGRVLPANTALLRARAQAWLASLSASAASRTSAGPR